LKKKDIIAPCDDGTSKEVEYFHYFTTDSFGVQSLEMCSYQDSCIFVLTLVDAKK
jgi:hypothetical protein